MKVRIFVPSGDVHYSYDGSDYDFEVIPKIGERIRFTDFRNADYVVTSICYIQEGEAFVAAVYTEDQDKDDIEAWVDNYQPSRS